MLEFKNQIYVMIPKKNNYIRVAEFKKSLKFSGLNPRGEMNFSPHKKNSN